ncbi:hypothetical protein [Dactylosporangium sp. NPDC048998]|uniref:hypothetical protein n=1 Tax=Dactylosporangium sp. NPDC048998 TaxID=3363976 RepID=UPI0037140D57
MTVDQVLSRMAADEVPPDCTVRFDDRAGCGVNVELLDNRATPLVGLTFVTHLGVSDAHDLTLAQVEQLRAALDAVTRTVRGAGVAWSVVDRPAA